MSLIFSYGCWLSFTVSPVLRSCQMSLTVFNGFWLSLTLSLVPWSCYMSLTVSHYCWFTLTVFSSAIELLHVSNFLIWLRAVSHCISGPMELLQVCSFLLWQLSLTVSPIAMEFPHVSHCLSLLLAVSLFLTVSMVPCSCSLSLMVASCLSPSLPLYGVAACLSISHMVSSFH